MKLTKNKEARKSKVGWSDSTARRLSGSTRILAQISRAHAANN